ncbi:MAG: HAMP domain-containing histidine kinase [Gemmatimonadetes bacterium]|nr:HAMP domain-containing histidine kinase [Gemmatimonadota bacterium]
MSEEGRDDRPMVWRWWLLALVLSVAAAAEWGRLPGPGPAAAATVVLLVVAVLGWRASWWGRLLAVVAGLAAAGLTTTQWQLHRASAAWPEVRESLVAGAADRWAGELKDARELVAGLTAAAEETDSIDRRAAFALVAGLTERTEGETGLVVVDADGTPYVWGGRVRELPEAAGDSIAFRGDSPYLAVLESRRPLRSGRVAVATVLLAADSAVPDGDRSLASRFERRTGVGLAILPPGLAPDTSDVFDYMEPTSRGLRLLFSVQLIPPTQRGYLERIDRRGVLRVAAAIAVVLLLAMAVAPRGWPRFVVLALPALFATRASLGDPLGFPVLFSPATFFDPLLGPASEAAGPLLLISAFAVVAAIAWLGAGRVTGWWGAPIALLLLVAAPYLVSRLGRGIQLPATGATGFTWLAWQLTVFLVAAALILIAAGLLPRRSGSRWTALLGAAGAVLAAVVGLLIWNARFGWADWYPLLWAGSLGLVVWPGRRPWIVLGSGIAVGSAAALMVWGAEVEARVAAGRADLGRLGARAEPLAVPLLEAFLDRATAGPAPLSTSELFALWRASPLSRHGFPSALGIWTAAGEPRVSLRLAELDLPDSLVGRLVRSLDSTGRQIAPLQRIPAVHYLAMARLDAGAVLAVGLGPRTALVPPARLGRVLQPISAPALYRLTLAPTGSTEQPHDGVTLWRRIDWTARGSRTVAMADGARDVAGVVELGRPVGLFVRGALLVVLDCLVLLLLAALADWMARGRVERPGWWPDPKAFRTRIAVALGAFFLIPAAGFALLNIVELSRDGQGRRDLMIAQTLRDAAPSTTLSLAGGIDLDRVLDGLAERVDANLALYKYGLLTASSGAGVFEDFSVVDPLIDPRVFQRMQFDNELAAVTAGPSPAVPSRIGVRAVRLPTGDPAMLASPQPLGDPEIAAQQRDLAYGLALAVVIGLAAALVGAQWSARALSRPVADLRDAALAFGQGHPLPEPRSEPPPELQPVFGALSKMAEDIRSTQEAQERAARVLAWGEIASQVAHEIKNPLTPMRLGIQHLQRVHRDGRPLGPTLDDTARRILGEIDRLDTIARAFSRFAAPAEGRGGPEATDLEAVCREVVDLYALAPDSGVRLEVRGTKPVYAHADEVKETVINLLENARNAKASSIVVTIDGPRVVIADDGVGIPADRLARIFEPRFSTTTSGSGLGLAIVKKLVEGWGAAIAVESEPGRGTRVRIDFRPAAA